MKIIKIAFWILLLSFDVQAKVFRNAYLSFEMPDSWKCNLEQTEWVCRSDNTKEAREAIIILTAKEVGQTDSFQLYETHLGAPISSVNSVGQNLTSKVIYKPKNVKINDQQWVDGLHLGSEVANYFTRYLATIKDRIAVLVTFSAHQTVYTKYSQDFFKAVMSLRVIATKNLMARPDIGPIRPGSEVIGAPIGGAMLSDPGLVMDDFGANSKKSNNWIYIVIALLFAGIGGYFLWKSKKK